MLRRLSPVRPWLRKIARLKARFLPSLTDVAFLMPLSFIFLKLDGARTLLSDGDTGWHIRTGEWILNHHQVPLTDIFSFSNPGAPWFAWEWLWDVIFQLSLFEELGSGRRLLLASATGDLPALCWRCSG